MTEEAKQPEQPAPAQPEQPPQPQVPKLINARDEAIYIFSEAAAAIGHYISGVVEEADKKNEDANVTIDGIFQTMLSGIGAASARIQRGLVPVSLQEAQVLGTFRQLKDTLKDGEKITFAKVEPKQNPGGIVGADGRPLGKDGPKLIVPK